MIKSLHLKLLKTLEISASMIRTKNDGAKNCYCLGYNNYPEKDKPPQEWANEVIYICRNQTGYAKSLKHYTLDNHYPYHDNNYPKKYPCIVKFKKNTMSMCCAMQIYWEYIPNWKYMNLAIDAIEIMFNKE